jgi:DNA-binding CsgD family transcriptional regulator
LDTPNPSTITAKGKIVKKIEESILNEGQWDLFQQQFELIEPSFLKNILNQFPALTPSDLKILTLIRMNLDSNEIARILRRTPESTKMARYRLRKRLELSNEESLEQFVTGFE